MIEGSLSRRYAKALFELALEEHREEEIGQEIDWFVTAYTTSSLPTVLNNPAFPPASRKNIVVEVSRGLQLSPLAVHFLSLLLERDRLTYLPSIASRYRLLLDEKKGRVEARVVAPAPLEAAIVGRVACGVQQGFRERGGSQGRERSGAGRGIGNSTGRQGL